MAKVKFEVTAEVASAVAGLLKVATAEAKVGQAAQDAAAKQGRAARDTEANLRRMTRAAESAANRPVFRNGLQVRRQDLASSQIMRAIGASGAGSSNVMLQQAADLHVRRLERAMQLRTSRYDSRIEAAKAYVGVTEARLSALRVAEEVRAARDTRIRSEASGMANAAMFTMGAGGVRVLGEGGKYHDRAVRNVSRQLSTLSPELAGKVSENSYNNWVAKEEGRLSRNADRLRTAGGIALGGGAAGIALLDQIDLKREERAQAAISTGDAMRGLLGLGDNMKNGSKLIADLQAQASGWGRTFEEVVGVRYNIESLASTLPKKVQDSIFTQSMSLGRLTPGDDGEAISSAITKFMLIKGKELKSPEEAASKLLKMADIGGAEVGKLATLSPEIFSAAGQRYSFDEIAGSVAMVTRELGRNETAITGLKMVMARMRDAEIAGLVKEGGTLLDQVKQLENTPADLIRRIFQDEGAAAIGVLRRNIQGLKGDIDAIAKTESGLVSRKVAEQAALPEFGTAGTIRSAQEAQKNALARMSEGDRTKVAAVEQAKLGSKIRNPNAPDWWHNIAAYGQVTAENLSSYVTEGGGAAYTSPYREAGQQQLVADKRAAGLNVEADAMELTHGVANDLFFKTRDHKFHFTREIHANEFRALNAQGYKLTKDQYLRFLGRRHNGSEEAAQKFLRQFGPYGGFDEGGGGDFAPEFDGGGGGDFGPAQKSQTDATLAAAAAMQKAAQMLEAVFSRSSNFNPKAQW